MLVSGYLTPTYASLKQSHLKEVMLYNQDQRKYIPSQ